jgi:hypothetical protein
MVLSSEFAKAYVLVNPGAPNNSYLVKVRKLEAIHEDLVSFWYHMQNDYASFVRSSPFNNYSPTMLSTILNDFKGLWLFKGFPVEDFEESAQALLIKLDTLELDISDYAILLYISYQEDSVRSSLENLPISSLRDIFEPMADEKFNSWLPQPF